MSLRVLRAGLDTVIVSYGGEIAADFAARLDALKELAQASEVPQPVCLGLSELFVQPKAFSRWRWHLSCPLFSIVARPKAAGGDVLAQIRLSAFGLGNEDAASLLLRATLALQELGSLREMCVSRADVCADFQGWTPAREDMANMVCPAAYRGVHGKESADETYQFGKKTLLRLYNKSVQIVEKKKPWTRDLWAASLDYDAGTPVWRVEYQAETRILKETGLSSSGALLANPGGLLDYGMRWAQLRVPNGANKTRWEEDPRWTAIRASVFGGPQLHRTVKASSVMSLDRVKRMALGCAATAGAYFGTDDFLKAMQQLSFALEVDMKENGTDFAELVETKRRRILSGDV